MRVSESAQVGQWLSQPALESVRQSVSQQLLFNQSVRSQTTLELADIGQPASHHMTLSVSQPLNQ